jgi:hypothetical protein
MAQQPKNAYTGDPKSHPDDEFKSGMTGTCLCGSTFVTFPPFAFIRDFSSASPALLFISLSFQSRPVSWVCLSDFLLSSSLLVSLVSPNPPTYHPPTLTTCTQRRHHRPNPLDHPLYQSRIRREPRLHQQQQPSTRPSLPLRQLPQNLRFVCRRQPDTQRDGSHG